ncbi:transposase [Thermus sp. 2.9]|uniref:transposase n=1 Tax=Thermus sp. (strain 2.9) TaxID=1577051 RepID=UPI00054333AF|nr:transposase [Thermus sp. 2.9]KHG64970.1 transposase [Thermus sp. 2.9]
MDDPLQAMGHKDDPQTKTPSSVLLTLCVVAAMHFGGNHRKTPAFARDFALFSHIPSPSRFSRRIHPLKPYLLAFLKTCLPFGQSNPLLSRLWKDPRQAQGYALDTFPLPTCENIRAQRSRLTPGRVYRGYIPSKRVYFHGFKPHLLVDDRLFVHEVGLTLGSAHDLNSLFLLPLEVEEGKPLYLDRGYESHVWEEVMREAMGIEVMPIRKRRSKRYVPWSQYLAILGRRVVETVGSMSRGLFPRRIHAVTQERFVLKVLSFVLVHNIRLLAQRME